MTDDSVLASVEDGIARITLNRPEVRNALSQQLVRNIEAALEAYETDPAARVIVLAGAGDRAFCAGADLKASAIAAPRCKHVSRSAASRGSSSSSRACGRR